MPKIIIAIDGYSSTGKSTFAQRVAEELGYIHLDSGALYRAVSLYGLRNGMISAEKGIDAPALVAALPTLDITLRPKVFIGEEDVSSAIRSMEVSSVVSPVSAIAEVREYVDSLLHRYGDRGGVVMDGRDIGSQVFPNAQLKIFMEADAEVRAMRRYRENIANGITSSFEDVLANLLARDAADSSRKVSPLRRAEDAILLDNTDMTMDDQMVWLKKLLSEKYGFEFETV
ncbi:MAG: (d)CMP kinase [Bacteroidales bacterium]|nr:(d)CMP kinase [Bacteroidales bacterium]